MVDNRGCVRRSRASDFDANRLSQLVARSGRSRDVRDARDVGQQDGHRGAVLYCLCIGLGIARLFRPLKQADEQNPQV